MPGLSDLPDISAARPTGLAGLPDVKGSLAGLSDVGAAPEGEATNTWGNYPARFGKALSGLVTEPLQQLAHPIDTAKKLGVSAAVQLPLDALQLAGLGVGTVLAPEVTLPAAAALAALHAPNPGGTPAETIEKAGAVPGNLIGPKTGDFSPVLKWPTPPPSLPAR